MKKPTDLIVILTPLILCLPSCKSLASAAEGIGDALALHGKLDRTATEIAAVQQASEPARARKSAARPSRAARDPEPNDSFSEAKTVSLTPAKGISLSGQLGVDGDRVDYFAFVPSAQGYLDMTLFNTTDPARNRQAQVNSVRLLDENGDPLARTGHAGPQRSSPGNIEQIVLPDRRYLIEVTHHQPYGWADYRVELKLTPR